MRSGIGEVEGGRKGKKGGDQRGAIHRSEGFFLVALGG